MQHDAIVKRHYGTFVNPHYREGNFRFEPKSRIAEELAMIGSDIGGPDIRSSFGRPYKGGGGGGKGVVGAVVGIVATVVTAGALAPVLAGAMFGVTSMGALTVGQAMVVGALTGAASGAVGGLAQGVITGQNIGQSMLRGAGMGAVTGGVMSGVGAYMNGASFTSAPVETAVPSSTGAGMSAAAPVAGDGGLGTSTSAGLGAGAGTSGPLLQSSPALEGSLSAGLDGGAAAGAGGAGAPAGLGAQLSGSQVNLGNSGFMMDGTANAASQSAGLNTAGLGSQVNLGNSGFMMDGTTNAANPQPSMWDKAADGVKQAGKQMVDTVTDPKQLASAGLKLGTQAIGAAMTDGPDMGKMNSYLDDMKAMQGQANQMNIENAQKKAAIGDQMQQTAANYNPEYYGMQNYNATKNRRSQAWADQESQLRAQGYDQNYINAMKNKFDLDTSTAAGTSYDSGWQTGQNMRTQAYGAAGGMYGQVAAPQAGLSSEYLQLYKQSGNDSNKIGSAIEQAFTPVGSTNTTGTAQTTKKQQPATE